jgi:Sulfotransferase family
MSNPSGELLNPPIFVLCIARSGSTLLRLMLGSHDDVACPPETNMAGLAQQLTTVSTTMRARSGEDATEATREAVLKHTRCVLSGMINDYLTQENKSVFCDKSLGTAKNAELLKQLYPQAKFICLYRHPMDVIASGIEASPWGVSGYGFEPYISTSPTNAVGALARFWLEGSTLIHAFEEKFPESCHRVRYEDLVLSTPETWNKLLDFLSLPRLDDIETRWAENKAERIGPADYKIWYTKKITGDSVGNGWRVPAGLISPFVLQQTNTMIQELGYIPIDGTWGTANMPLEFRAAEGGDVARREVGSESPELMLTGDQAWLHERLGQLIGQVDDEFSTKWSHVLDEPFTIAALPRLADDKGIVTQWKLSLRQREVSLQSVDAGEESATKWDVVGATQAWRSLLEGQTNVGAALRRCDIRYCSEDSHDPHSADQRLAMLADFTGLGGRPAVSASVSALAPARSGPADHRLNHRQLGRRPCLQEVVVAALRRLGDVHPVQQRPAALVRERGQDRLAPREHARLGRQLAREGVEGDQVAVPQPGERPADGAFRRDVQHHGAIAGSAHPRVADPQQVGDARP